MTTILSPTAEELLSLKELATELKRSPRYVMQMKKRGFSMPGGRATLRQAIGWLVRNPRPFETVDEIRRG